MKEIIDMQVTAIAPWFGSKRTLASRIVAELGPHSAYWEPCCGSMAVLLAKEPATMETVNDLHGDLINLALVIRDPQLSPMLYGRLARTLMHEGIFRAEAAAWKANGHRPVDETPDLERAYRFFLCSWMGMNGVAGTSSYNQGFCARFTKNGGHAGTRFCAAVDSIPDWHQRLSSVTILSRDCVELCEKIEDADGVVIYADPPYLVKGAKYVHDFATTTPSAADPLVRKFGDHGRLALALRRFTKTRVVVSYYEHPDLAELYPDWTKVNCELTKSLVSSGKRTKNDTKAPEVLLINGPSLTQEASESLFDAHTA